MYPKGPAIRLTSSKFIIANTGLSTGHVINSAVAVAAVAFAAVVAAAFSGLRRRSTACSRNVLWRIGIGIGIGTTKFYKLLTILQKQYKTE